MLHMLYNVITVVYTHVVYLRSLYKRNCRQWDKGGYSVANRESGLSAHSAVVFLKLMEYGMLMECFDAVGWVAGRASGL